MRRTTLLTVGALALTAPLVAACGGGGSKTPSASSTTGGPHSSLTVHAKDALKFDKTAYTATAGTVDVTYVNDGTIAHTLDIQNVKGFKLGIGTTDHGTVDLKPGTYTIFCDLPGHEAAGMKATLTVS